MKYREHHQSCRFHFNSTSYIFVICIYLQNFGYSKGDSRFDFVFCVVLVRMWASVITAYQIKLISLPFFCFQYQFSTHKRLNYVKMFFVSTSCVVSVCPWDNENLAAQVSVISFLGFIIS